MNLLVFLPAAGASARMGGRDKLLEEIDGVSLLRRQTLAALAFGRPVAVSLDPARSRRAEALDGLEVTRLDVADAAQGMSASLAAGAAEAIRRKAALMLLLPDVPGIGADDLRDVFDAWDGEQVLRASDPKKRPGTPLLLPARILPRFLTLRGDEGGRRLLAGEDIRLFEFPDDRATRDLDTPEDWALWRRDHS